MDFQLLRNLKKSYLDAFVPVPGGSVASRDQLFIWVILLFCFVFNVLSFIYLFNEQYCL